MKVGHGDWTHVRARNFQRMIELVFVSHPYYSRRYAALGIAQRDIASLADLQQLPVTTKQEYMSVPDQFRLETHDREDLSLAERTLANVIYTTGSTAGNPTPFYDTNFDHASRIAQMKVLAKTLGITPSDVIANLFPLTPVLHQGFLSALYAALASGAKVFATFTGHPATEFPIYNDTALASKLLQENRPTVLWGITSYVRRIVSLALTQGTDLSDVRLVFLAGEPASVAAQEELRAELEAHGARDVRVENGYGFTEMQGPGVRCVPGGPVHLPGREAFYMEVLDPASRQPVPPGADGMLAITHLNRRGTVLVRYLVGDICAIRENICSHCGEEGPRLVSAPRRTGDLVKIKGTLVNTSALVQSLDEVPGLVHSQVRVRPPSDGGFTEELIIYVVTADGRTAEVADRIRTLVRSGFELTPVVSAAPSELRDELTHRYKVRRFVDERVDGVTVAPTPTRLTTAQISDNVTTAGTSLGLRE